VVLSQAPLKLAAMASRACSPVVLQLCAYATLDTASDAVHDAALTSKDSLLQFCIGA